MKILFLVHCALIGFNLFMAPATQGAEPKPIFNRRDFSGWNERGQAIWEVRDGVIVGKTGKGGHGWLCTTQPYGDFVLELEVKAISGNSGVQVRSHINEQDVMLGYQIEVDPSKRAWSGGLYEQGGRGWLQDLKSNDEARAAFKTNEWNHYRIICVGDSIKTWINRVPAADYVDSQSIEGVIALQVHSGKNAHVQFRNIRLQDLGRRSWKPLWDGKSLSGWHTIGKGNWDITDGAIHGTQQKAEAEYGHLVSDRSFRDFTMRLKFKALRGNSGLYFRIEEKGFSGITGFQAEIDPDKDTGGLYETNGRSWVSQPDPARVKKWFKPNEWNTMTVSAHKGRIAVDVNGFRTAELLSDFNRNEGKFALQVHGGQDVDVYFKDIEILTVPARKR